MGSLTSFILLNFGQIIFLRYRLHRRLFFVLFLNKVIQVTGAATAHILRDLYLLIYLQRGLLLMGF
jgi:hypothetical protein